MPRIILDVHGENGEVLGVSVPNVENERRWTSGNRGVRGDNQVLNVRACTLWHPRAPGKIPSSLLLRNKGSSDSEKN